MGPSNSRSPTPPQRGGGASWRVGPEMGHCGWSRRCRWAFEDEQSRLNPDNGLRSSSEARSLPKRQRNHHGSKERDRDKHKEKDSKERRLSLPFAYSSEDPRIIHLDEIALSSRLV